MIKRGFEGFISNCSFFQYFHGFIMWFCYKWGKSETKNISSSSSWTVALGSAPQAVSEGPVLIFIPGYQVNICRSPEFVVLDPFVSDEEHMFRSRRKMFCGGKNTNIFFHYLVWLLFCTADRNKSLWLEENKLKREEKNWMQRRALKVSRKKLMLNAAGPDEDAGYTKLEESWHYTIKDHVSA